AYESRPAVTAALNRLIPLYTDAVAVEKPAQSASVPAAGGATTTDAKAPDLPKCTLNSGVSDAAFASRLELEILAELNLVRADPKAYTAYLRQYRERISGKVLRLPNGKTARLKEGVKPVDEAIRQLSTASPLPALSLSRGLSRGARDHARDLVRTVRTGHDGSDGSRIGARVNRYGKWAGAVGENISYGSTSAREFVISLLVDDGVLDRGHRKIILERRYRTAGVAVEENHPSYGPICVQTFAGAYAEKQ
ncbi:MAG: CAP domain-containing protein, partial [Spirochaetota bacterium]